MKCFKTAPLALPLLLSACGGGGGGGPTREAPLAPTTYYVDAVRGSDTASGGASEPFRTIARGIGRLAPGDTLCIAGGDYRAEGTLMIRLRAEAATPVVVESCSGRVEVDSVRIEDSAWVELRGLTIASGKALPPGWPDMPEILIDSVGAAYAIDPDEPWSTRAAKVDMRYHSYSTFVDPLGGTDSWEYALYSEGIGVSASQHVRLAGNTISLHTVGVELRNESSSIVVEDNAIRYCLDGLRGDKRAIDGFSYSASTIRRNLVEQSFREGIRLSFGASDNVVEDNLVQNTGHSHIATWQAGGGNTIRRNVLRQGGYYAETMRWPGPSAISVHSAGAGTRVEANSIARQVDMSFRDGNGVIIDNNGGAAVTIANNLIHQVMGSGISSVFGGNATIQHNTIVDSGHATTASGNGMGIRLSEDSDVGNTIANNLIVDPANGGIWFRNHTLAGQAFIDNNLYDFSGLPLVADGLESYADLAAWRASGHGLQALQTAARLEQPAEGLFGVAADSPARGAGSTAHGSEHDLDGTPRASPPTIGAFEATAASFAEPKRFLFGLHSDPGGAQDFVATTREVALVNELRAQLALPMEARTRFVNGPIERGGHGHNLAWNWHFLPGQWTLTDSAIELCDGTPAMLQADLAYSVDVVAQFCPWDAYVKAEL